MRLSVVIPTFDTAEVTLRCCASAAAALPSDAEVIVVDDGSTDGTAALLREALPSIAIERDPVNRGFATAANRGVAASRGEIVLLLNSDTQVERGTLDALLTAFGEAKLGIAGMQLVERDGAPQWSAGATPTMLWLFVLASGAAWLNPRRLFPRMRTGSTTVDWVSGAAMAFRREVWDAVGPLREDFRFYAQDLDFCLRAASRGWDVRLFRDLEVEHLRGATISRVGELRYAPELLWCDLLLWARGHYGEAWARRARKLMLLGAALRIVVRKVLRLDRDTTAAFERGYQAMRDC